MEMETDTEIMDSEEVLQNKNPPFLIELYEEVLSFFMYYGWYCLLAFIGLLYIYIKLLPHLERYLKKRAERKYDAMYHKNSDLYLDRLSGMEKARQKMQKNLDRSAEEYMTKLKQKEGMRRELLLQQTDGLSGNRLGNSKTEAEKKSWKSDYNPLIGAGGSGYRAPKRSACGGGGCGKK